MSVCLSACVCLSVYIFMPVSLALALCAAVRKAVWRVRRAYACRVARCVLSGVASRLVPYLTIRHDAAPTNGRTGNSFRKERRTMGRKFTRYT